MKKNNRFIFIITCLLITTINCSSLFGTAGFNKQLNVFVNENNLSHEDIQWILSELNQIEYTKYNKQLKKGLKKIGKLKEKESEEKNTLPSDENGKYFVEYAEDNTEIYNNKTFDILAVRTSKLKENILKLRE
jgi:conserved domain protein